MTVVYLGIHRPPWTAHLDVPLFISASTLAGYKTTGDRWPTCLTQTKASFTWAFDSGAYTAHSPHTKNRAEHPWHLMPDDFGGMVTRVAAEIGPPPRFAAIQDMPCEPEIISETGLSVAVHQELTSDSYEYLDAQFPHIRWAPVLQGWKPDEYLRHMDDYRARGVDLSELHTVGLGSVCRRGSEKPIVDIVEAVQAYAMRQYGRRLRLHGFGMNIRALRRIGHLMNSCDGMAWSATARLQKIRLPECTHRSKYCNNCWRYALLWRDRVVSAIEEPKQESFDILTEPTPIHSA